MSTIYKHNLGQNYNLHLGIAPHIKLNVSEVSLYVRQTPMRKKQVARAKAHSCEHSKQVAVAKPPARPRIERRTVP